MLCQLIQSNDSFEFRTAVDWKGISILLFTKLECQKYKFIINLNFETGIGLMDYPNVVKYPMDLGTVRDRLRDNEYVNVEECLDDIQLVWDNCKNYNAEGSVMRIII